MEKEITFAGLSASPSGHLCKDGELAACIGMMPKNGELAPARIPEKEYVLPEGWELTHIHSKNEGSRLIAVERVGDGEEILYWASAEKKGALKKQDFACIEEFGKVKDVASRGALLIIATSEGLEYAHWTDAGYAMLDLRNPPIAEFGLQRAGGLSMPRRYAAPAWMAAGNPNHGEGSGAWATHPLTAELASDTETATQTIFRDFKEAVRGQIEAGGYFHSPFFVRYALRLADGSHILPSPPALMLPSLLPPMIKASALASSTSDEAVLELDATGMNYFKLRCRLGRFNRKDLGPYVTAIDIFVTESASTFSETPAMGGIVSYSSVIKNRNLSNSTDRGRAAEEEVFAGEWSNGNDEYADRFVGVDELRSSVWNITPNLSMASELLSLGEFHLVGSIPISEAQEREGFKDIDICSTSGEEIRKLPTLEADETDLARRIIPDKLWGGGGALMAAAGEIRPQRPWPLAGAMAAKGSREDPAYLPVTVTTYTRSLADDGNSSVTSASAESPRCSLAEAFPHYLYSSDPGTYKIEIRQGGNGWSLPMRKHPTLAGAYWVGDLENAKAPEAETLPQLYTPETEPANASASLWIAEGEWPFAFTLRATIGAGRIKYLANAYRAMSAGQFGQYTLYAFTTAGIWAMSAAKGSAPVRISEKEAKGIAVTGSGVAFTAECGAYHLCGAQIECLSAEMAGAGDERLLDSDAAKGLMEAEGIAGPPSFAEAIGKGTLTYDAEGDNLLLAIGDTAYSYSFADKRWGMTSKDGKAMIISRPIKIAYPVERKGVSTVSLTGSLSKRTTKVAALGSDDLRHWRLLGSAQGTAITAMLGTGVRYLAIAASSKMEAGDTLSGAAIICREK
ncbi:MAG: hypothetical protein NC102_04365 [Clostridium sp.]|nr:hypothetical protein [Clostridium sp.]